MAIGESFPDVFEDGHRQLAFDDGFASRKGGVLAGNGNDAGQTLGLHGLECAEGGAVVGSHNSVDIVVGGCENVLHNLQSIGVVPVFDPLVGHDLNLAGIHEGLDNFHLTISEQDGIIICGASPSMTNLPLSTTAVTPRPWARPTSTLSNDK
jgi:hypothetical protein